ncbi:MAG: hypothetical protein RIS47_115 [Bacteroidota bacterium]|jgi:pantoate--beta-alanine ligase
MQIAQYAHELNEMLNEHRVSQKTIGFVPTMGALHLGHISLVSQSLAAADCTVVSIFVNPTQFNNPNDLKMYPRTPEADLEMLRQAGCDIVYMPSVKEVYPEDKPRPVDIDLGILDTVLEGKFRPGHFSGVASVVYRLFSLVKPTIAFFGEKDFQQLAVIRLMNEQLNCGVQIVAAPIVREEDGLAMSSRNTRLKRDYRTVAPFIYMCLSDAAKLTGTKTPDQVAVYVRKRIAEDSHLKLEYFEIVDKISFERATQWDTPNGTVGCIAVWADQVRLIDNIQF